MRAKYFYIIRHFSAKYRLILWRISGVYEKMSQNIRRYLAEKVSDNMKEMAYNLPFQNISQKFKLIRIIW